MITLLIATRNLNKAREISSLLGANYDVITLRDFHDAPEVVEDANTFAGNAKKKSNQLAVWLSQERNRLSKTWSRSNDRVAVVADDSGLEVDALGGAPGVHSARFAALDYPAHKMGNSSDQENNAKLLRLLADVAADQRTARFRCVLALTVIPPAGHFPASPAILLSPWQEAVQLFDGTCEGHLGTTPRGKSGFGYDPLFIPNGYALTFAELGESIKNQISHRAQALQKLKQYLADLNA